ncbi:autotransporter domain-containing protein [Neolewinella lacunae]|uniref:Autotransporter domain-containing protein n=1 Tax=Neolewinella lacunae TaxID=1517758 RepID=A0A923T7Z7_9BACT|nr:autotransporter domain-containing protein [Neolewinella lacunae]MBC6995065.1 autotransporter domain-containing protein [Neolewinella lacunae]MDN3635386.1 autotransporter domain-containing protein [Neolewinella lacunae]
MRNLLTLCLACLLSSALPAQFGLMPALNWHETSQDLSTEFEPGIFELQPGYEIAAHYWFRLPEKRVEFQPSLYYAQANTVRTGGNYREFGLQYKVNIYPFDFGTDCNCPTFGKQGPQLQKGFFVQVAPGYSYHRLNLSESINTTAHGFTLGGGMGMDIGLSNLLTLTPIAGLRYHFSDFLGDFVQTDGTGMESTIDARLLTFQLGLQLTFRLDERRY